MRIFLPDISYMAMKPLSYIIRGGEVGAFCLGIPTDTAARTHGTPAAAAIQFDPPRRFGERVLASVGNCGAAWLAKERQVGRTSQGNAVARHAVIGHTATNALAE